MKSGILKIGAFRNPMETKRRRVRFAEKDEIREIEARPPKPNTYSRKSLIRPVDVQTLTKDILLRICNWSYKWISVRKQLSML